MAVCPGNSIEPLPSPSENLQIKEVSSLLVYFGEGGDLIDRLHINPAIIRSHNFGYQGGFFS